MRRSRIDDRDFRMIAEELGVSVTEVQRAVHSFFDAVVGESRRLPFNSEKRIYTKERFNDFAMVYNVPFIGRLGPVYSRYLKWRENESKEMVQANRRDYRSRMTQDDIEHIAEDILAGNTPVIRKRKKNEMFNQVWMVGKEGKTLARQVIPKEKKDVQD